VRTIRRIIESPVVVRRNHLFHYEPSMSLDIPLPGLSPEYDLYYPYNFEFLTPDMFEGGKQEYLDICSRAESGDRFGVVIAGNKVVHRSLVQTTGIAAMEGDPRAISLRNGQIYIHWCETVTSCSGMGLYSNMLRTILTRSFDELDLSEALIACRQNNIGSIKGIMRAGFVYLRSSIAVSFLRGAVSHSFWHQVSQPPEILSGNRNEI
jgi:RimJ/RimL family protein N-acetyltransferase